MTSPQSRTEPTSNPKYWHFYKKKIATWSISKTNTATRCHVKRVKNWLKSFLRPFFLPRGRDVRPSHVPQQKLFRRGNSLRWRIQFRLQWPTFSFFFYSPFIFSLSLRQSHTSGPTMTPVGFFIWNWKVEAKFLTRNSNAIYWRLCEPDRTCSDNFFSFLHLTLRPTHQLDCEEGVIEWTTH